MTDYSTRAVYLNSRARHPASEAVRFVENRIVVAGQSDAVYSEQLDEFVPVQEAVRQDRISADLWKQADAEKDKLFALVAKVQAKLAKKGANQSLQNRTDIRNCRWGDVLQQIQETAVQWSTAPNRTSQTMMYIDKVGRNSAVFESWLNLLPAGDYGASVCGVFKLVIGAAGQYIKIEEAIFGALAEIPEIIQGAQTYVKVYTDRRDQSLERKTFELFLAILRTLTHIMQFFADGALKKTFELTLNQSAYKSDLLKSIDEIRKHAARIKEEADQCLAWAVHDQNLVIKNVEEQTAAACELLRYLHRMLEDQIPSPAKDSARLDAVSERLGNLEQRNLLLGEGWPTDTESRTANAVTFAPHRKVAIRVAESVEDAKRLLGIIGYDPDILEIDLERSAGIGSRLEEGEKARAAAMIRNSEYKTNMVESSVSTSLLVNGRADLAAADGMSPLAHVAGTLVLASRATGSIFLMAYFCDYHRPSFQPSIWASSVGIIASFVGQLLEQMLDRGVRMDLSFLTTSEWARLENMKLDTLWRVLRQLIGQLPPDCVLICVIDEISRYETTALHQDTEQFIRRLTRLVRKSEPIVFKLLLTCQGRALGVSQYFEGYTVDLDAHVEPEDSSAWWIRSANNVDA